MRFAGEGGFYGRGVYLAENPAYQVGGRYAHRLSGHGGARMQLLIVRAALGTQQQLGTLVTPATRKMTMPANRSDGRRYDSVCAGPHRPGRVEARAQRRRPKYDWLMTKPHQVLRE